LSLRSRSISTSGTTVHSALIKLNLKRALFTVLSIISLISSWEQKYSEATEKRYVIICVLKAKRNMCNTVRMRHPKLTANEILVHHYEPESKKQTIQWKHKILSGRQKFLNRAVAKKSDVNDFLRFYRSYTGSFSRQSQMLDTAAHRNLLLSAP
jgi:hypothetical protein